MHYVVLSVYYKHGLYELKTFSFQKDAERYILEFLEYENRDIELNLDNLSFDKLIEIAIELGQENIENQRGSGITEVLVLK